VFDYKALLSEIQETYCADNTPWVIGFSGGKDSTTVLQMVFYALSQLPKKKLSKEVHVVSSDTLVENPTIGKHVDEQLQKVKLAGKRKLFKHNPSLFKVAKVTPKLEETFWVNLIGKGYPSPNRWFRWCTERMKINPTNRYILDTVNGHGRAIVVLGTRKAESANRSASMSNYDTCERLRNHRLRNVYVYAPIADLSNHEVWAYLLQSPSPWGANNRNLLSLYGTTCSGGECPFTIETGTQSCGKSRFGCWVCTVVDRDKSMENIIENGEKWLEGLLKFRNWLYDIRQQTNQYVPKRLDSKVKFGPFLLRTRNKMLNKLLRMQDRLPISLITPEELDYINEFLEKESEGKVKQGLRKYGYELPNGKRVAVIADFNILLTPRKRLGPLHLKEAKLVKTRTVSQKYLQSTRVMYYSFPNGE
jgi:DNA sulfur modification protein DndC